MPKFANDLSKKYKMPAKLPGMKWYGVGLSFLLMSGLMIWMWLLGQVFLMGLSLLLGLAGALLTWPSQIGHVSLGKPSLSLFKKSSKAISERKSSFEFSGLDFSDSKSSKTKKSGKSLPWILLIVPTALVSLLLATAISAWAAITLLPSQMSSSLVKWYYLSWWSWLPMSAKFAIVTFLILSIILVIISKIIAKFPQTKNFHSLARSLAVVVITAEVAAFVGWQLALPLTLGLSAYELNRTASKLSSDPQSAGFVFEPDQIAKKIGESSEPLQIVRADRVDQQQLFRALTANPDRSTFYRDAVEWLPANAKPKFSLPEQSAILINNQLILRTIDKTIVEKLALPISRRIVGRYFQPRHLKDGEPSFAIIGRQDYIKYRNEQINDQMAEIDGEIAGIDRQIAAARQQMINAIIQYYEGNISYEEGANRYYAAADRIPGLQSKRAELVGLKRLVAGLKDRTPDELGIFVPDENSIKVVLDNQDLDHLDELLAVMVHEYLHYTSYVDDERRLGSFFEEGLTEYYTRRVVEQELGRTTDVGYIIVVPVIEGMASKLPADKLADVYFTKSEDTLESLLNEEYGKDFYADSQYHFLMISLSDLEGAVKLANDLIGQVGGTKIDAEAVKKEVESR
jgi:hypothetical protein